MSSINPIDYKISVDPFEFINISDCLFIEKVNDHSTGYIKGFIQNQNEDKYLKMSISAVEVTVNSNGIIVFEGLVDKIETQTINGVTTLELYLISYSSLLDVKRETFTFQDAKQTYKELVTEIIKNEEYSSYSPTFIFSEKNKALEELIVQYKETDWNFLKRLASHFNSILVSATQIKNLSFYFGIKEGATSTAAPYAYKTRKDVSEYHFKHQNKVAEMKENDSIYYEIDEYTIRKIGDSISFKNNSYLIYAIERKYVNYELVNTYLLKDRNGFNVPKYDNENITGASLDASVIDVSGDTVKACVLVDGTQDIEKAKWFAYSTIYSSPDGSGWYAMPEVGDNIRLYFPTTKENNGYIINSVHINQEQPSQRMDPNDKLLMNKHGKFVLLKPEGIFISNGGGLNIQLIDESGITISSDKKIEIAATDAINIHSTNNSVNILGKEGIVLTQEEAEVEVKDSITFKGLSGIFN